MFFGGGGGRRGRGGGEGGCVLFKTKVKVNLSLKLSWCDTEGTREAMTLEDVHSLINGEEIKDHVIIPIMVACRTPSLRYFTLPLWGWMKDTCRSTHLVCREN